MELNKLLDETEKAIDEYMINLPEFKYIRKISNIEQSFSCCKKVLIREILSPSLIFALENRKYKIQHILNTIDYTILSNIAITAIENKIKFIYECIEWSNKNINKLRHINGAELLDGDSHNMGMTPMKITYSDNNNEVRNIVIKGGDAFACHIYNEIAKLVCASISIPNISTMLHAAHENFFARDFAESSHHLNFNEVRRYFFTFGVVVSIAKLLQMVDLHYENIIPGKNGATVIDGEVLFHGAIYNSKKWSYKLSDLLFTKTSPLSQEAERSYVGGYLSSCGHMVFSSSRKAENFLVDRIGDAIVADDFMEFVDIGIKTADECIMDNLNKIFDIIYYSIGRPHQYRYVMLPTLYYRIIQLRLWNPGVHLSFEERVSDVIKKLQRVHRKMGREPNEMHKVISSEIEALKRGDIPFFSIDGCSGDLISSGQVVLENFAMKSHDFIDCVMWKYRNKNRMRLLGSV